MKLVEESARDHQSYTQGKRWYGDSSRLPLRLAGGATHRIDEVGFLAVHVPGSHKNSHAFDGGELCFPADEENAQTQANSSMLLMNAEP